MNERGRRSRSDADAHETPERAGDGRRPDAIFSAGCCAARCADSALIRIGSVLLASLPEVALPS